MAITIDHIMTIFISSAVIYRSFLFKGLLFIFFITGIDHSFNRRGTTDYREILKWGIMIGLSLGFMEGAIGYIGFFTYSCELTGLGWIIGKRIGSGLIGFAVGLILAIFMTGVSGVLKFAIPVVMVTSTFMTGVFIGELLERKLR